MPPANTPKQNTTVLVVDDDNAGRERLCAIFEKAGFRALVAHDAASTLRLVQTEPCELVVLNLGMTGVDPIGVCKLLRARPSTSRLPIIAFSRKVDETEKNEIFAAGADDYIVKPSSPAEIVSRSSAHLRAAQREWELIGTNRELRFLSDLGKGLLRALEPDQLVRRVAGATYEGTGATLCATYVRINDASEAVCVFDREGSAEESSLLELSRLQDWLGDSNVVPVLVTNEGRILPARRNPRGGIRSAAPVWRKS